MATFQYAPDLLAAFPTIIGGILIADGLTNRLTPEPLRQLYQQEQAAVLERIGDTPLSELPSLAAWRAAFRAFGVDPTQYRSAAEALLRRLTKKGDIPSINTLVDVGNLVSIRYGIPIAVIDRRSIAWPITARFADGTERFVNLNQAEADHPAPGEVIFADENARVVARRWCWRQSDESGAREDTSNAVITVEAHHTEARANVEAALEDLVSLLTAYSGGRFAYAVLSPDRAAI